MNFISAKSSLASFILGACLLAGSNTAQSAIYTCSTCNADSFLSGSISFDGIDWDWSNIVLTFGKKETETDSSFYDFNFSETGSTLESSVDNGTDFVDTSLEATDLFGSILVSWDQFGSNVAGSFGDETFSAVPVPAAGIMFAPAMIGLLSLRRKRRI